MSGHSASGPCLTGSLEGITRSPPESAAKTLATTTRASTDQNCMESNNAPLDQETIAALAKKYWQADGEPAGRDMDYWLRAESELQKLNTAASSKAAAEKPVPKPAKNQRA